MRHLWIYNILIGLINRVFKKFSAFKTRFVPIEYDLHQPIYLLYLQHPIAQACHTSVVSSKGLNRSICGMKKGAPANPSGVAWCFYVFV
jgi:hypothetical protein